MKITTKTIASELNKKINSATDIDERIFLVSDAMKQAKFDVGSRHKQIFVFQDNSKLEIMTKSKKAKIYQN